MGSLSTSLLSCANSIQVYNRQLAVIQDNISNANTPGYASQTQSLTAMPMNLNEGLAGGVQAGPLISTRSDWAEQAVQTQVAQLGTAEQQAQDLSQVQNLFSLTSTTGVDATLSNFFDSFSQLSVSPNDTLSRQNVLNNAQSLATAFNQTATGLASAGTQVGTEINGMVSQINQLASQIRDVNSSIMQNFQNASDPGLDAQLHADLEQLSEVAGITTIKQSDGSTEVLLGGQTPLVVGDRQFQISAQSTSPPQTSILNSVGNVITSQVTSGQLAGALQETNQMLPSYTSSLNTLAQGLADGVNQQLAAGVDQNGATPTTSLFNYDATTGAAMTLSVNPLTPDQIAAATPDAPGGNANALNVAAMASATTMGNSTYTEYFGTLGGQVGTDLSNAQTTQTTQQGMVDQARTLRSQVSGVSIDAQAAQLLQVQQSYQATAKLMSVLNDMMDTLMNIYTPVATS
jgi:flagellar hook-associated protein 1 FlgK